MTYWSLGVTDSSLQTLQLSLQDTHQLLVISSLKNLKTSDYASLQSEQ